MGATPRVAGIFGERPSWSLIVGGSLILAGGLNIPLSLPVKRVTPNHFARAGPGRMTHVKGSAHWA